MEAGQARPASPLDEQGAASLSSDPDGRKDGPDRRARPTRFYDSLRGWRRRGQGRRDGETEDIYVDVYRAQDVALITAILALNVLDAFFTLRWLDMGGGEANPLMDWLIDVGDGAFLIQKCIVVGIWLVVLVIHKNFRVARVGMWSLLVLYSCILLYHIFLQVLG